MEYIVSNIVSFVVGIVSWELFWKIFVHYKERWNKSKRRSLDIVCSDLEKIHALVEEVQVMAYKYYSAAGLSDEELSRDIKIGVKQIGERFSRINKSLDEVGHPKLSGDLMISYRKSITIGMDLISRPAWDLNSNRYDHIVASSSALLSACRSCQMALARK